MTRSKIDHTHTSLKRRAETEQVYVDGDQTEAIFRALVDGDEVDAFEQFVEDELGEVSVQKMKWVGFGMEVTLR